ncbi:NAD-dependent epimerase/dehydratase [Sulfolobus islandicus Y.N.15.51]|jgi:Nucleoside-diphosphate-sugar epimerases|uniref:NAD-dependent epimerase/dehydratase n=1 Tax=Saccharolobus islandicus (strain Y.N.15.51 / Yellowstone \|nr:NAD(P)-dependent oxidoreductase [Sulfolobus islandicus]ACP47558.1 NAD-dependent epimerase/dehydratase [Sulfolobus islandicus Y.N.15.51]
MLFCKNVNMKILTFGGTGFVGSNFVRYALSKGHDVLVYARNMNDYAKALQNAGANIIFSYDDHSKDVDCLVYFIGAMWTKDPKEFQYLQVKFPTEIGRKFFQVNSGKFVYISSIGVSENIDSKERPILEESPHGEGLKPNTLHGITKLEGEKSISKFPNYVILRFPIIYGPYSRILMWRIFMWLTSHGIGIKNDNMFSVVSTRNASKAIELACKYKSNDYFYITDKEPVNLTSLFSDAAKAINREIKSWFPFSVKLIEPFKSSHEMLKMAYDVLSRELVYSYKKAERELGYIPEDVRVETFKEMARYYKII